MSTGLVDNLAPIQNQRQRRHPPPYKHQKQPPNSRVQLERVRLGVFIELINLLPLVEAATPSSSVLPCPTSGLTPLSREIRVQADKIVPNLVSYSAPISNVFPKHTAKSHGYIASSWDQS